MSKEEQPLIVIAAVQGIMSMCGVWLNGVKTPDGKEIIETTIVPAKKKTTKRISK